MVLNFAESPDAFEWTYVALKVQWTPIGEQDLERTCPR